MKELLEAVVDVVALVSPSKVNAIANAFRGLKNFQAAPSSSALADTPAARTAMERIIAAWSKTNTSGNELAGIFLGASEARVRLERELSVELVWTGPTTRFVPTRRTAQVLIDLIASAQNDLFLVSFVAYDVKNVVKALHEAVDRGVKIFILLEASVEHGGTLNIDPGATMKASVPSAEIFTWKDKAEPFVDGKVHAKVAVVDSSRAFITSANLTGHALEKNMEAGVLINGGDVPKTLKDHLQALVDVGVIVPCL